MLDWEDSTYVPQARMYTRVFDSLQANLETYFYLIL